MSPWSCTVALSFELFSALGTVIILNFPFCKAYFISKRRSIKVIDLVCIQLHLLVSEWARKPISVTCGQWSCWVESKPRTLWKQIFEIRFLKPHYPFKLIHTCGQVFLLSVLFLISDSGDLHEDMVVSWLETGQMNVCYRYIWPWNCENSEPSLS